MQHGGALALPDDDVSEPAAAVSRVPHARPGSSAGPRAVEARSALVPPLPDAGSLEALGPQVAAAHGPHSDPAGDVPRSTLRAHPARSVRSLRLDDAPI